MNECTCPDFSPNGFLIYGTLGYSYKGICDEHGWVEYTAAEDEGNG